jgi:hypothetical protein
MFSSPSQLTLGARFANDAFEPPVGLTIGGGLVEKAVSLMGKEMIALGELPQAAGFAPPGVIAGEARPPRLMLGRHQAANMMSSSSAP